MRTIILVDDDIEALTILGEVLSRAGHHVIPKSDAESALSVIREGIRIDLVMTDYRMPGMDGCEFMRILKHLIPSVPVIVLTASESVDIYIKFMSLGAFEYIAKPVRASDLECIVKAALERPQADDHLPIHEK